ncbi:MAG TPA: amidase [Acidimicrobiia bacterium]|jgi:amidase|nr:MAG: amidase [Actinomycetota bacterium]HBL07946.1 amidase [Acidimicrobiaceae bacterium]HIM65538.1 amidase [Acidimicrobiia bacterium]HIM85143.1 amidase [Acidimicrobiia bacterium]
MTPMTDDPLLEHDALGLAALVRAGEVTPDELLDATLARTERLDGTLNAIITECVERARTHAARVDPSTPFAGVPTFLKDLVDLEGTRRTDGSASMLQNVSAASPAWVTAAEVAGLVVAGKTNTPEFASLPVTDNMVFGPTRNPWDPNLSSGGSSGGAAASVAAGYTPVAHGTDGGGSNRIPASWCGVFGMKPSRGRLASGELDGSHPVFKTHMALSRSVRDNATVFLATQGDDAAFPHLASMPTLDGRRLRIALTLDSPFGEPPEPAVQAAVEDAALLCQALGHEVVPVDNPVDGAEFFAMYAGYFLSRTVGLIDMLEQASGLPIEESGLLSRCTIEMVREGDHLPSDAIARAEATLARLDTTMAAFLADHDVWLTPVTATMPLLVGDISPREPFDRDRSQRLLSHLAIANAIGGPAMSVPLWWDDDTGLPVGSHFSAAPGSDETLYGLAFALEEAQPWAQRWAPTSARFL